MNITTIYGKAGCGKSTTLAKLINKEEKKDDVKYDGEDGEDGEDESSSFIVLAPTNSAVENIYKICSSTNKYIDRNKFKTIYSYFRIDYENNIVLGAIEMVDTIYIDEFSLIDKYLFKKCVLNMKKDGCKNLILCGDVMQLNAIYNEKQYISFNKINKWNNIYKKISEKMNKNGSIPTNLYPKVIEHLHLNVFGMKMIQSGTLIHLNVNMRSNEEVKNVLTQIYSSNRDPYMYKFTHFVDLPELICERDRVGEVGDHVGDGGISCYTFIASKYKILQQVYDYIYNKKWKNKMDVLHIEQNISFSSGYKDLYLYPGMSVIVCDTDDSKNKSYINGEELIFTGNVENNCLKCLNKRNEIVYVHKIKEVEKTHSGDFYPISPSFLLTIHKSQGRTIENVIVCIDELFDVSMMYTAITRAKENLIFYTKEKDKEKQIDLLMENAYIPEFKQLNLICSWLNKV